MGRAARVWLLAPEAAPGINPGFATGPAPEAVLVQMRQALAGLRPPAVVLETPDLGGDEARLAGWLAANRPDVMLCLRQLPPRALSDAAMARGVAVVLADADIARWPPLPFWQRLAGGGGGLARLAHLLVPDPMARAAALRRGAIQGRITVTGALTETRPPLRVSEAELSVQAEALGGRQRWYAVAVPEAEEKAVIEAHNAALGLSHRALLLIQPADPARAAALAQRMEDAGLHVALRSDVDEVPPDHQALVLDDPNEPGLWYRLAPVCFMGGTLSGEDAAARHPFEAAALGSAILHGPVLSRHAEAWHQLDRAGATRLVPRASALADHLAAVMEPERAADLASRAWNVSTGGAAVARQIAGIVAGMVAGTP